MSYKLVEVKRIRGKIKILTGLHIGAGSDEIRIGGMDNPVVKNPVTGEPYIPGSSLKGKARALLEWYLGKVNEKGVPWDEPDDEKGEAICRIFGVSGSADYDKGPSRAIFRDSELTEESKRFLLERGGFTEEKTEVSIDRIRGTAGGGGPRKTERVPAGAEFNFEVLYKILDFEGDGGKKDRDNLKYLLTALKLIELDALGGCGSRGYGKIKFEIEDEELRKAFEEIELF